MTADKAGYLNGVRHWPHEFVDGRCACDLVLITIRKGELAHPIHAMVAHHHATAHLCGAGYCDECTVAIDDDGVALADIVCAVVPEPAEVTV